MNIQTRFDPPPDVRSARSIEEALALLHEWAQMATEKLNLLIQELETKVRT